MNFRRLIVGLTLGWLALFVLLPHLLVLLTSVLSPDSQSLAAYPFTLESYARLWQPIYAQAFWQSLWLAGLTTLICLLIGYPFAWILSRMPPLRRALTLFMVMLPFWTNSLIRTYAIKLILGNKGLLNTLLLGLGLTDAPLQLLYTPFAVVFGLVYILLPFMVLPLVAAFDKLDPRLLEAARDLGAGLRQRFAEVVLPLTLPGAIAGSLIVFLPAMGMFYVADLLGGARNLLLGNIIKNQFLVVRDWPFGAALSITLIALMGLLLWLYARANARIHRRGGIHDSTP